MLLLVKGYNGYSQRAETRAATIAGHIPGFNEVSPTAAETKLCQSWHIEQWLIIGIPSTYTLIELSTQLDSLVGLDTGH
jgi:hypothetical protein